MSVEVTKPGLSTTVQDLGRPGYYHLGIPISGAMDRYALRAANLLVGNQEGDAALEATFLGPELRFHRDALVAVTGAEMVPRVDGTPQPTWTGFAVRAGQTLGFDFLKAGARAIIGVSGGFDVPVVLGSRSTYALGALGGHAGRALQAGDVLPMNEGPAGGKAGREVPAALRRDPGTAALLRVITGLYWHRLVEASQESFFANDWAVAPEADRIGYRFRGGSTLQFLPRKPPFGAGSDPSNIVDSGYPYGSIQVPGGTEPIVLHRDAVSGGGYFMLGTVISADMDLIGQLQPHAKVRFRAISMEEALAARGQEQARLDELRHLLHNT